MSVQRALEIAQHAVTADTQHDYLEARRLYMDVVYELDQVYFKESGNSVQQQAVLAKANEYRTRIRAIEGILASQGYPVSSSSSSSSDPYSTEGPSYECEPEPKPEPEPSFPAEVAPSVPDAPSVSQHLPDLNKVRSVPSSGSLYVKPTVITKPEGSDEKVIGMYGLKYPSEMGGSEAWQTGTELAARGKSKERSCELQDAFELYKCSMLYYMRALNSDDVLTRDMKQVCREQMKEYLTRAEMLKKKLVEAGHRPNEDGGNDPNSQYLAASYANASQGLCCICGRPLDKFICVLNRQWHPQCFVNTVKCAFCGKPFSLIDFRYVVDKETGLLYHVDCREYTIGLSQQEIREGKAGTFLLFQVSIIGKRLFMAGESVNLQFDIENSLSYKINSVRLALVMEEARSTRNARYERVESKPVITQVAGTVESLNGRLPMGKGKVSERISFPLCGTLLPSVLTDYTLRREYKLKVKAVLSGMNGSIDKEFTIIIAQEK